jgi:hypothetical protein
MTLPFGLDAERGDRALRLLRAAGGSAPRRWLRLSGGANNQVFRLECGEQDFLLKAYFVHPEDQRDRLRADYGFARFAWDHGLRRLARPVACDAAAAVALFDYLPGRKLTAAELSRSHVREALQFYLSLNTYRDSCRARALPDAAEACFTPAEHLHCIQRRLSRLQHFPARDSIDTEALAFVHDELLPCGDTMCARFREQTLDLGLSLDQTLATEDCCLSPSDFGFHNALLMPNGQLHFIDFEYAGWDDPGKLVADFFCQPECPVPVAFFDEFAAAVAERTAHPDQSVQWFRLLLPLYRLKWCCILLNDFLPAAGQRRRFAVTATDAERKPRQLLKARAALLLLSSTIPYHQPEGTQI